ncbi:peptidoglycan-binding domain-containing protein [Mycobacterium sp. pR1184]|uniref:peptidoglycan-binding domain-containing protein n=1 Tax=Mycobacterium sp. pR1184 TaxID=3238981 RepID=UPI00351B99D3
MSLPYRLGSNGPEISYWQSWFQRWYPAYAPPADGSYGNDEVVAVKEMQRRLGLPQTGEFDVVTAARAGYTAPVGTPPPAIRAEGPRHLAVVHRGTGGIIGEDPVSRVCQAVSDLVEEQNPTWAATMGGIPVGTAGNPADPSMNAAVAEALTAAQKMIGSALQANPKRKVILGGYSSGAEVTARLRKWMAENHPDNYLCSFSMGDPTRPPGGCFYPFDGWDPGGQGIASWHYGDIRDARHCWLTNTSAPGDMYARVPRGKTGEIMQDAYDMVTNFSFRDPVSAAQAIVKAIPEIAEDSGIEVPDALKAVAGGVGGIAQYMIPLLLAGLAGLIGLGNPDTLTGTAAAAAAARIGLTFLAAGTGPHIRYPFDEVWPGQTYLGLAIQHVRDWATRVAPVAA